MKKQLSILFIFLSLVHFISAQTEVPKHQLDEFLSELKIEILNDTSKYDRANLFHNSLGTHNKDSYSRLYIINGKYAYKLDIISGALVKEFADEVLKSKRVKSIQIIEKSSSLALYGTYGGNGSVLIELRKSFKPEIAGLQLTSTGGNNFDQKAPNELLTR